MGESRPSATTMRGAVFLSPVIRVPRVGCQLSRPIMMSIAVCMVPVAQRGRDQQIGEAAVEPHGRDDSDACFARGDIVFVERRARAGLLGGDIEVVDAGSQRGSRHGIGRFEKGTGAIDDGMSSVTAPGRATPRR